MVDGACEPGTANTQKFCTRSQSESPPKRVRRARSPLLESEVAGRAFGFDRAGAADRDGRLPDVVVGHVHCEILHKPWNCLDTTVVGGVIPTATAIGLGTPAVSLSDAVTSKSTTGPASCGASISPWSTAS